VIPDGGLSHTEQQRPGDAPPAAVAAVMRDDELGHLSESPASVAASDGAPARRSRGSFVPVCIVLLVLVVIAIAIWVR
jgi:hypothetical protein